MKFSKQTGGFYDPEIHGLSIPADAVEVSQAKYSALMNGQSTGKVIAADSTGRPVLVDPADNFVEMSGKFMANFRELRDRVLNRLTGIAIATNTQSNFVAVRKMLLDIPDSTRVTQATSIAQLKSAISAEYQKAIDASTAEMKTAFEAVAT